MSHHYYVVYFDDQTKEWVHDYATEDIRFREGTIWSDELGKWQRINDLQDDQENNHMISYEILNDGLIWLNRISAVNHLVKDRNE